MPDTEYDCRKEYACYKQGKGWKHLVVYKSDIHAFGLHTSRFIFRGEIVVKYVDEIVGYVWLTKEKMSLVRGI